MAQYGLDNFLYEITVEGDKANFKFWDNNDVSNTAEVSIGQKDFPEGAKQADSREVAELAYAQCQKVLNDKRDERISKEAVDLEKARKDEEVRSREIGNDFLSKAEHVAVAPVKTEADGTNVYNTAVPTDKKK